MDAEFGYLHGVRRDEALAGDDRGAPWLVGSVLQPTGVVVFATLGGSGPSGAPGTRPAWSGLGLDDESSARAGRRGLRGLLRVDWLLGR